MMSKHRTLKGSVAGFPLYYDNVSMRYFLDTEQFPSNMWRTRKVETLAKFTRIAIDEHTLIADVDKGNIR